MTGGNRNDITQLLPLLDTVGPVTGRSGRPRKRAERLLADRGYDHDKYRRELRKRGVKPVIARRGEEHGSGLGKERWVVERTFAWLHNLRRLRTRYGCRRKHASNSTVLLKPHRSATSSSRSGLAVVHHSRSPLPFGGWRVSRGCRTSR